VPFPAIENECQVAKENIKKHIEKLEEKMEDTGSPDFTGDIVTRGIEKRIAKLHRTLKKLMKIHEMDSEEPEVEEMFAKEMARKSKNLSTTTGKELEELEEGIARNCRTLRTLQMSNDAKQKERIVRDNIERRYEEKNRYFHL
tara:strand:+ start:77 stop:505 length:429 start_codon:yes stop_codon:yes gene_type:complete